jgi:hypothetical protein
MAAGGALIAAAALAGSMAGPASASDWHDEDGVGGHCNSAMADASTWQRVDGRHVWQGTRDAGSCKRDWKWGYGWGHGWGHHHGGDGYRGHRGDSSYDGFLWDD